MVEELRNWAVEPENVVPTNGQVVATKPVGGVRFAVRSYLEDYVALHGQA